MGRSLQTLAPTHWQNLCKPRPVLEIDPSRSPPFHLTSMVFESGKLVTTLGDYLLPLSPVPTCYGIAERPGIRAGKSTSAHVNVARASC